MTTTLCICVALCCSDCISPFSFPPHQEDYKSEYLNSMWPIEQSQKLGHWMPAGVRIHLQFLKTIQWYSRNKVVTSPIVLWSSDSQQQYIGMNWYFYRACIDVLSDGMVLSGHVLVNRNVHMMNMKNGTRLYQCLILKELVHHAMSQPCVWMYTVASHPMGSMVHVIMIIIFWHLFFCSRLTELESFKK
jgi:hypothetical protein